MCVDIAEKGTQNALGRENGRKENLVEGKMS